jgi:hypothetical protein
VYTELLKKLNEAEDDMFKPHPPGEARRKIEQQLENADREGLEDLIDDIIERIPNDKYMSFLMNTMGEDTMMKIDELVNNELLEMKDEELRDSLFQALWLLEK